MLLAGVLESAVECARSTSAVFGLVLMLLPVAVALGVSEVGMALSCGELLAPLRPLRRLIGAYLGGTGCTVRTNTELELDPAA